MTLICEGHRLLEIEVVDLWYWYRGRSGCTYAQGGVGVDGRE
jgi:hypothetical protein